MLPFAIKSGLKCVETLHSSHFSMVGHLTTARSNDTSHVTLSGASVHLPISCPVVLVKYFLWLVALKGHFYIAWDGSRVWCEKCHAKLPQEIQPLDDEADQTSTDVGSNMSSRGGCAAAPDTCSGAGALKLCAEATGTAGGIHGATGVVDGHVANSGGRKIDRPEPRGPRVARDMSATARPKNSIRKIDLLKRKVPKPNTERWVMCDRCQQWAHQASV